VSDAAAAPTVDAGLQVGRVGDEAVGAYRSALLVAGDGFAAGRAACAFFDAGVRDTRPADPHPIQGFVDAHDAPTAGAGRPNDPSDTGGGQQVDQTRDSAQRREVAIPGDQTGLGFQRPGQSPLVGRSRRATPYRRGDGVGVGVRVEFDDHLVDYREWVALVWVWALGAAWLPTAVSRGNGSGVPAGGARFGVLVADRAVPVLAAALERSQVFAALGAARW
jgi:hypothetical protein